MSRDMWTPVYLGLGSNLDDPFGHLARALQRLAELPLTRLIRVSGIVRSAPLGPANQPDYLNAVAALLTRLEAAELLRECQAIEARHGRRRDGERWGPRTLDIDILVFGDLRTATDELTIPHPGLAERAFVLGPLREIAPALSVPGLGPVAALADACDLSGLAPAERPGNAA